MDDKIIPHLVARFLSWKLPPDFHPDAGISFVPDYNNGTPQGGRHEPTGTNLLNAEQAFAMVRHLLDHPAFSAALSSAIPRAEADDGWRTIESAPKTDPVNMRALPFLGWCPDKTATLGGDIRVIWWEPVMQRADETSPRARWYGDRDMEEQPTHWCPLPAPPAQAGER